jgi:hypothetical protein
VLLKNSLSAPKLQYLFRAACCDGHGLLTSFDNILKSALCSVCNVFMTDQQWLQASLPVLAGGLGIRLLSSLASSAFLASAAGTCDLQDRILCLSVDVADEAFDLCLEARLIKFPMQSPTGSAAGKQKIWDNAVIAAEYNFLLACYSEPIHRARLLAAAALHSGD